MRIEIVFLTKSLKKRKKTRNANIVKIALVDNVHRTPIKIRQNNMLCQYLFRNKLKFPFKEDTLMQIPISKYAPNCLGSEKVPIERCTGPVTAS